MAILGTFTMQPADQWDYDIDYGEWLPESDGLSQDTLPTVKITPEGLKAETVTRDYDNKRVKIWLSGGLNGTRHKVEVTTRSWEGRVRQDEFFIIARDF